MSLPAGRQMAAALIACVTLAACAKKDATADSAAMMPDTMAMAPAATSTAAALTDANILYMLDKANMADSASGSVAAGKATSGDVKGFGNEMMKDHHDMRKAGEDLSKKLDVMPMAPADDKSAMEMQATMDKLNGAAKGMAFDTTYINDQVMDHEAVLQKLATAQAAAQHQELKDMIAKATSTVQDHLDKAKAIQSKMMK